MQDDPFEKLPTRDEVGREIVDTANRARRLRSLYRLIARIESEVESEKRDTDHDKCAEVARDE